LMWRKLTANSQVVCLNSYHNKTGDFLKNDFVHVEMTILQTSVRIQCSCNVSSIPLGPFTRGVSSTCCHSRLMKDIYDQTSSNFINFEKIENAKKLVQYPIVTLPSKTGINRYSIRGSDGTCSFVTISTNAFNRKTIKCHSGRCQTRYGKPRKMISLQSKKICCHLELLRDSLPETELADNSDEDDGDYDDDDITIPAEKWEKVFDIETGLWSFNKDSPSKLKVPFESCSDTLKVNFRMRMMTMFVRETVEFSSPCQMCINCNKNWSHFTTRTSTLYSSLHAIEIIVKQFHCRDCGAIESWDGVHDDIYRSSRATCAGYEIGWEYVESVLHSKETFSGFVAKMNEKYERASSRIPFMSVQTFIDWFFGWASSMQLDFRVGCKSCGDDPKVLACDGTKIGTCFKNVAIKPIETPVSSFPEQRSRRLDRCVIRDQYTREALRKLASTDDDYLQLDIELVVPEEVQSFVYEAISVELKPELTRPYRDVLKQISHDSSIAAMFPHAILDESIRVTTAAINKNLSEDDLWNYISDMEHFNIEISTLLRSSIEHNGAPSDGVFKLIDFCCRSEKAIHDLRVPSENPDPIPGTYNPPRDGRAYYFTEHGQQLRQMRSFPIDKEKKKGADDDEEADVQCNKRFPEVSRRGITYLFLWFCPLHGHCFGYHMIPSSEGRKDPAASLYMFKPKAPHIILYDFACSFDEYARNRESGYFCCSRFFHDIFHGFSHKCGSCFRCERLVGMNAFNTSICEQFNAFMQCVKQSAKLMSQTHFNFYVQFFVHIWNVKKAEFFKQKMDIVKAGQE